MTTNKYSPEVRSLPLAWFWVPKLSISRGGLRRHVVQLKRGRIRTVCFWKALVSKQPFVRHVRGQNLPRPLTIPLQTFTGMATEYSRGRLHKTLEAVALGGPACLRATATGQARC